MRYSLIVGLLLVFPVLAFAASPQAAHKPAPTSCQTLSASLLQNLQKGHFKAATAHFDSGMKSAASPEVLKKLWKGKLQKFGAFESAAKPKKKHGAMYINILTPLQFAHGRQTMLVSCNGEHQIQGLFFKPGKIHMNPQALEAYVGRYKLAPSFILKVFHTGDQLYAQPTGQSAVPIYPSAKNEFFAKAGGIRISFRRGSGGKVNGLVLHQHGDHPAPRMASSASPAKAPTRSTAWIGEAATGAKTLPITVQRDGFALKGVLNLPAGKGPFSVVDIIPGSGPVNINGNAGPLQFNMYKKLAAALVKSGWAVARVAKRFVPPSTGSARGYVFDDQVADNLAIVKALRNNPHIEAKRIVVAGHSLGGLVAPELATETHLAGLILLEAPGEKMAKLLTAQLAKKAQDAGASATRLSAFKQKLTRLHQRVIKAPPGQTVSYEELQPLVNSPNGVQIMKSLFQQSPLATARKVKIPVLVVQGGYDLQVLPGNGKQLVKAFPNAKLLYVPTMGHDLVTAPCLCEKQTIPAKDATLAPRLAAGIIRWLKTL
jgi:pimeloyl-ACP methyl ester carboxylesterase